ncbi:hypothetical protein MA16_Dca027973 [Dendrobium catenatum]|uniref:Uncharacterized protein n=1 Tax=Dendrobium catenatum TaxID=906689 RepID=A0A2I0VDY5_9ASPA|nr:hypothetical protein MA16_Dca027973 [Dendrobium catenatum]
MTGCCWFYRDCSGRFDCSAEVVVFADHCCYLALAEGFFRTEGFFELYPWFPFWEPGKLLRALRVLLGTMMTTVGPCSPWRVVLRQPGDFLEAFHSSGCHLVFLLFLYSHYL